MSCDSPSHGQWISNINRTVGYIDLRFDDFKYVRVLRNWLMKGLLLQSLIGLGVIFEDAVANSPNQVKASLIGKSRNSSANRGCHGNSVLRRQ